MNLGKERKKERKHTVTNNPLWCYKNQVVILCDVLRLLTLLITGGTKKFSPCSHGEIVFILQHKFLFSLRMLLNLLDKFWLIIPSVRFYFYFCWYLPILWVGLKATSPPRGLPWPPKKQSRQVLNPLNQRGFSGAGGGEGLWLDWGNNNPTLCPWKCIWGPTLIL